MKEINENLTCECGHGILTHEIHSDGFIGATVGKCLDHNCDCEQFIENKGEKIMETRKKGLNKEKKEIEEIDEIDEIPIIDWDYTIYDYEDLIDDITDSGWILSRLKHSITDLDTNIVNIIPIKKDSRDVFMEITCPDENLIIICGLNQGDVGEEFLESPNLYTIPHFFTLRLADENDSMISPATLVSMTKINSEGKIEKLYQEFYGDLSPYTDGKLKTKGERYYFMETIILQRKEKLVFQTYKSNKDISKINLFMMCDFFNRDKK